MAQKVLVMGESGTGKSTSMRNCDAAITAVVNPVGKPLPFKNHFDMLNNETDARKITKYMKDQAAAGNIFRIQCCLHVLEALLLR